VNSETYILNINNSLKALRFSTLKMLLKMTLKEKKRLNLLMN